MDNGIEHTSVSASHSHLWLLQRTSLQTRGRKQFAKLPAILIYMSCCALQGSALDQMLCQSGVQNHWGWRIPQAESNSKLPEDPRCWSREDVAYWLSLMQSQHHIPEVPVDRFLMNGKGLCLMTMDMFLGRVPLGGKLLYKDFQLRLGRAMYAS